MHYTNYFLKADSEVAMFDALRNAGMLVRDENGLAIAPSQGNGWALDIVGTIYAPTGAMLVNADGEPYPAYKAVPGYHANLRTWGDPDLSALQALMIAAPATPKRMWAGD